MPVTLPDSPRKRIFAPPMVAWATRTSVSQVNQLIDRREVVARGGTMRGNSRRAVGLTEVLYIGLRDALSESLSRSARKDLYTALRKMEAELDAYVYRGRFRKRLQVTLVGGIVTIAIDEPLRPVAERLRMLREAEQVVVEDEGIRGGEPIVKGTRIPVHALFALSRRGVSEEQLLEDYPALDHSTLRAALTYAETHPRRGRPRAAPWHG